MCFFVTVTVFSLVLGVCLYYSMNQHIFLFLLLNNVYVDVGTFFRKYLWCYVNLATLCTSVFNTCFF